MNASDPNDASQRRNVWWTALSLSLGLHAVAGSLLLTLAKMRPSMPQAPATLSVRLVGTGAHQAMAQPGPSRLQSREASASSLLQDLARLPPPLAEIPEPPATQVPAPSSPRQPVSSRMHKAVRRRAAKPLRPSRARLSPVQPRPSHPRPEQSHMEQPAGAEAASETASGGSKAEMRSQSSAPPLIAARYDADYLHNPPPEYPLMARRLGLQGTVRLRVLVSAQGLAEQVRLFESSGSEVLDQAAVASVRRWRFVPARRGDTALESWVEVPVRFVLR